VVCDNTHMYAMMPHMVAASGDGMCFGAAVLRLTFAALPRPAGGRLRGDLTDAPPAKLAK